MKSYFIFDGNCGFCIRLSKLIQKGTDSSVEFISYHTLSEEELKEIHPDLNVKKCQAEVQLVQNQTRYPGFFAVRSIFWKHRTAKYVNVLLYLPLVPFLGMFVMMVMKRLRWKLTSH